MPAKRSKSIVFGRRMSEDGVGVEAVFFMMWLNEAIPFWFVEG